MDDKYRKCPQAMFGTLLELIYHRNSVQSKLHTIRHDLSNRWKPGMVIHFVINNRTKNRFQFAPVVKCVSVQTIEIWNVLPNKRLGHWKMDIGILVDGKSLNSSEIEALAINDGLDSVEDFFAYFNKDFKGKIIHWTDLKY